VHVSGAEHANALFPQPKSIATLEVTDHEASARPVGASILLRASLAPSAGRHRRPNVGHLVLPMSATIGSFDRMPSATWLCNLDEPRPPVPSGARGLVGTGRVCAPEGGI
jgi:hypothetical protein